MRVVVVGVIFVLGCRSSSSPITCELVGDHVHAVMSAHQLRTKVADLCKERDWSANARACVAGVPSLGELPSCAGELGDSAELLDKAIRDERRRIADASGEAERRSGLRIDLPSGRSTEIDPRVESLVLDIAPGADVVIGGKAIAEDQLDNLFRTAYARKHETQVILRAARDVPHARIVELMERAKRAGLSRLAIGTRPE